MSKCTHACEEKWNADYEAVKFQFKVTHLFPDHCPKEKRFFSNLPTGFGKSFYFPVPFHHCRHCKYVIVGQNLKKLWQACLGVKQKLILQGLVFLCRESKIMQNCC